MNGLEKLLPFLRSTKAGFQDCRKCATCAYENSAVADRGRGAGVEYVWRVNFVSIQLSSSFKCLNFSDGHLRAHKTSLLRRNGVSRFTREPCSPYNPALSGAQVEFKIRRIRLYVDISALTGTPTKASLGVFPAFVAATAQMLGASRVNLFSNSTQLYWFREHR